MQDHQNFLYSRWGAVKRHFPRRHVWIIGATAFALSLTLFVSYASQPKVTRHTLSVQLTAAAPENTASTADADTEADEPLRKLDQQVHSGDTLSDLFQRAGIKPAEMHQLLASSSEAKQLAKLAPDEQLTFHIDPQGTLQSLELQRDPLSKLTFTRDATDTFQYALQQRQAEQQLAYRSAEIDSSLFLSGINAGLSNNLIMEMANIFGSDIDFALDIRKGDHFSVTYQEKFFDGKKIGDGPIQTVSFTNRGETFSAVRYTDVNGDVNYYTPEGQSMRKAFIRTPLDVVRVTDHFNPRRLHPIFKTRRPHNGTDYAAPRGTPVYAAGSGRVIRAGYSKPNGNHVFIQHGERYVTRYLHLNKLRVKRGQRVKQRQVIGTVGSTGYATGPHLHYEFLVDGRHRNPATIVRQLPKAKSIPSAEMDRFHNQTQPLLAQLENYQQPALAQSEEGSQTDSIN